MGHGEKANFLDADVKADADFAKMHMCVPTA